MTSDKNILTELSNRHLMKMVNLVLKLGVVNIWKLLTLNEYIYYDKTFTILERYKG